jgi:hypothetical protein
VSPDSKSIPTAGVATAGVRTSPRELQRWVDALPFATLNAAEVKPERRAELLDIHVRAYDRLGDAVLHPTGGQRGAVAGSVRLTAAHVSDHIAKGYELVARQLEGKPKKWLASDKGLARAVQRGGLFICFSMLQTYARYHSPKAEQWSRLAALYGLGVKRKLASWTERRRNLRAEFARPLAQLYKTCVLASAVDPHRLGPGQVWILFDLLFECVDGVTVSGTSPSTGNRGIFVVDPRGRRRTMSLPAATARGLPDDALIVDANASIEPLRQRLSEIMAQDTVATDLPYWRNQEIALIERVLRTVSEPRDRSGNRQPLGAEVRLVAGVRAIQQLLGGPEVPVKQATFARGDVTPGVEDRGPELSREDQMEMIDPRTGSTVNVAVDFADTSRARAWAEHRTRESGAGLRVDYHTDRWMALDIAASGVGILKRDAPEIPVGVGQVVAVAMSDDDWKLGLVRWMRLDGAGAYRIGIEFLQGSVEAVALRKAGRGKEPDPPRPALVLTPLERGTLPTLIAPLGTIARGPMFELERPSTFDRQIVNATDPFSETSYFERLGFEVAGG